MALRRCSRARRTRHILDRCNPPGDTIGVTGMVFWPVGEGEVR
jgi:hypothetical protein